MDDTNPAPESGAQPSEQDNAAYRGLQKVIAKRDEELRDAQAEVERLRAEHEATTTELTGYRERDAEANDEETARQQYETLKARFEAAPPVPLGTNAPNDGWLSTENKFAARERSGTSSGWPT